MSGSCNPIGHVDNLGLRTIINSATDVLLPIDPMERQAMWELDESPLIGIEARYPESTTNGTLMKFHATNLHSDRVMQLSTYFTMSLVHNSTSKFPVSYFLE